MKKTFLLSGLMVFITLSCLAQKEVAEPFAEKRTVAAFHSIEVSAGIQVLLTKGDKEELAVAVDKKEYLDHIFTSVSSNGVLKITREEDWKFWTGIKNWKVTVYVSYTTLKSLKASSGSIIKGTAMQLSNLNAKVSSGGVIDITGKVDDLVVDASSGAMFKGYSLQAAKCRAESSSGGGVYVNIEKELNADASSGGYIRYKGQGLIRDINISSGGSVKRQVENK